MKLQLKELKCGEMATVLSFQNLDSTLQRRLQSLGVIEGCELCMKQKTFFGGPCIIECSGQKLSLRLCDAKKIEVAINV